MSIDQAGHLEETEITAYVDGELPAAQRAAVTAHLDVCAECRAEVGDVVRLLRTAPLERPGRFTRLRFTPFRAGIGIALAASLAAVMLIDGNDGAPSPDSVVRSAETAAASETRALIRVIAPLNQTALSRPIIFSWHGESATFFRLTLTTAEGKPLLTRETADTVLTLPATIPLEVNHMYFWNVDAIGNGITASTGMQRFTVLP